MPYLPRRPRHPAFFAGLLVALVTVASADLDRARAQGVEQADDAHTPRAPDRGPAPWLGVQLDDEADGARIGRIISGSPAAKADLRVGDVILSVADTPVDGLKSLRKAVEFHDPRDSVAITYRRDGEENSTAVTLRARPGPDALMRNRVVGQPFPAFTFQTLEPSEGPIATADLKGRPTLIEFWATWCPPCRKARRQLKQLHQTHGDALRILGVSGESAETLRTFVTDHSLPYPIVRDAGETAQKRLFVATLPTIFVLDASGQVVEVYAGTAGLEKLRATVRRLVENDKESRKEDSEEDGETEAGPGPQKKGSNARGGGG